MHRKPPINCYYYKYSVVVPYSSVETASTTGGAKDTGSDQLPSVFGPEAH